MEEHKEGFNGSTISDADLELILRERLKEDPSFYLDFLKRIIDAVPEAIDDKALFELLKPAFIYKDAEAGDFEVVPSPEGVDMLFYPGVRAKLKEWQKIHFDRKAKDSEQKNAGANIRKIFETLICKKKGRPESLSREAKEGILSDYFPVRKLCKEEILEKARYYGRRSLYVKKSFPDVGEGIVHELGTSLGSISVEKLRDLILAKRYNCSERAIEEFIRKDGTVKFFKSKKHPGDMIEQVGDGEIKYIEKKANHT